MKNHDEHKGLIAAYHAGRLSAEDAESIRARCASDAAFAAEVEALAPVSEFLARGFESGPSANYRLSADRLAVIRAAARGDIVAFPEPSKPVLRKRSRLMRATRRYGLATAAALAMMVGAVSGFESGRFQFEGQTRPVVVAIDTELSGVSVDYPGDMRSYVPAYGLDHADFTSMMARGDHAGAAQPAAFVREAHGDFGLPGPGSPYLRAKEILFLQ